MDEDQSRQQQQQQPDVRELLAKHTKQRQSKKKQEESRQQQQEQQLTAASGSQLPLRHWPDDASSTSQTPASMYSSSSLSLCVGQHTLFMVVAYSVCCSNNAVLISKVSEDVAT